MTVLIKSKYNLLILEIERNAEGNKLAYLSKKGSGHGFRIAGPKAWGGSVNLARFEIPMEDLIRFIKEYIPEIISEITQGTS